MQENTCQSQGKHDSITVDQEPLQNTHPSPSPRSRSENEYLDEAVNIDQPLTTTAEMEYTLISPPHLDLGIAECKTSSDEATASQPLSLNSAAEPLEASDDVSKRDDTLYDFRLSPLDYSGISNDPPQLNHYDYIPISPENDAEDKETIKSPRKMCEPCELSPDPTMMLIKNTPDIETDMPSNSDSPAQLNLPDEPQGSNDSQSLNYPLALDSPPHNKCTDTSSDIKTNVEVCHNAIESINHIDGDILSQAGSDANNTPCMQDAAPRYHREDTSGLFTLKPVIICEKVDALQQPTETQLIMENKLQQATPNQLQGDTSPNKTHEKSNMQQGKAICDICSMCFRTVPGLKRHKAMKHLVKAGKHILLENPNHQGNILSSKPPMTTEKSLKDNSQRCFQNKVHRQSKSLCTEKSDDIIPLNASESDTVVDHETTETKITLAADETAHHMPPLPTKVKKTDKARKNKNSELSSKTDPFSDELLNILKTDILQAITPDFQNRGIQEHCKSSEVKTNNLLNKTITETQECPNSVAAKSGLDGLTKHPTRDASLPNQINKINPNKTDTDELECTSLTETVNGDESCTDIRKDCVSLHKEASEETCETSEKVYVVEEKKQVPEKKVAQEILQKVSVKIESDKSSAPSDEADPLSSPAKGFLDDDTTFSKLFPRDEEIKRKKSPRVYSKKNKRQKLSPDSHTLQDGPPSQDQYADNQTNKTLNSQSNHCEYETISIDDAIMLNMCHNSSLKGDEKTSAEINQSVSDEKTLDNHEKPASNHLSPIESTIDKSSIEWSGLSDPNSLPTEPKVSSDQTSSKEDMPTTQCPAKASSCPPPSRNKCHRQCTQFPQHRHSKHQDHISTA